jgi:hypothetical protein
MVYNSLLSELLNSNLYSFCLNRITFLSFALHLYGFNMFSNAFSGKSEPFRASLIVFSYLPYAGGRCKKCVIKKVCIAMIPPHYPLKPNNVVFIAGVTIFWDKNTRVTVELDKRYQGKVCGLCGNYNAKSNDDFITRSKATASTAFEFGKSWKTESSCKTPVPDSNKHPCDRNPSRKAWAHNVCSILKDNAAFKRCHPVVSVTLIKVSGTHGWSEWRRRTTERLLPKSGTDQFLM